MIEIPKKRSISLRLRAPIGKLRVPIGQSFEVRAELRVFGIESCTIELQLDPIYFSEVHDFESPLQLRGNRTTIGISYTISALRPTSEPGVITLVARGNGAVQRAQFSVEVL